MALDATGRHAAEEVARAGDLERGELLARERKARQEAEAASQAKDEFLAVVSHELRTPLNTLRLWAGVLRNGPRDAQTIARAVDTIDRSAILQARLIEDLLDVSRIVSGRFRLAIERVDLAAIIEPAIETVRAAAENKAITLTTALDPAAGPVLGDATRLQQVVWNLLSNAVRFTPRGRPRDGGAPSRGPGGRADRDGHRPRHGARAPPARLRPLPPGRERHHAIARRPRPRALDRPADRGAARRDDPGRQPGRGARRDLHGVPARSRRPRRSARGRRRPARGRAGPIGPATRRLENVDVLVVDDDAETREVLKVALGFEGARVTTAPSVADAVAAIEQRWPDVLVSDIGMPGEDGYDLIRRVRRLEAVRGRHIPAIALTAYAAAEDRRRTLHAGYDSHVAKPVEASAFAPLIASLLPRERRA